LTFVVGIKQLCSTGVQHCHGIPLNVFKNSVQQTIFN